MLTIVLVTNTKVHDINMLNELSYEKRSFYIMDKDTLTSPVWISFTPAMLTSLHAQRVI